MAAGWVHQANDLIAYGRTYAYSHRKKDSPSQVTPGMRHRTIRHEWYQRFGRDWDYTQPFPEIARRAFERAKAAHGPDAAEEQMSYFSHDLIDKTWDDLPGDKRIYWEGFFAFLIYHPELLESWAEVDVIGGRIGRYIDGVLVWEESPETVSEYKALRREVSRHHKRRLRSVLSTFG